MLALSQNLFKLILYKGEFLGIVLNMSPVLFYPIIQKNIYVFTIY